MTTWLFRLQIRFDSEKKCYYQNDFMKRLIYHVTSSPFNLVKILRMPRFKVEIEQITLKVSHDRIL